MKSLILMAPGQALMAPVLDAGFWQINAPLLDEGESRMRQASNALKAKGPFEQFRTSPLVRAYQSMRVVMRELDIDPKLMRQEGDFTLHPADIDEWDRLYMEWHRRENTSGRLMLTPMDMLRMWPGLLKTVCDDLNEIVLTVVENNPPGSKVLGMAAWPLMTFAEHSFNQLQPRACLKPGQAVELVFDDRNQFYGSELLPLA
jgi:hypothetical protein